MGWIQKNRYVVLIVATVVLVIVWLFLTRKTEFTVRVEKAKLENIANTIATNGKMEPRDNFQAFAIAPAPVKHILVKEGDQVRPGQLLVQLEDADARARAASALAQLRAAEANLSAVGKGGTREEVLTIESQTVKARAERDSAQRNLTALKNLQSTGSASAGEVQEAENRLKSAQAELSLLEQKQSGRYSTPEIARVQAEAAQARAALSAAQSELQNANIVAPRAGTVYSLPVRQGAFVNAGDLIVQVADTAKMQVRAFVDEPEIGKLSIGQKVSITWDAVPGRVWEGTVLRVPTTVVTRGTRTVGEVVCQVDNADKRLLPNTNVSVSVTTSRSDSALTIAREAVIQDDNKKYVFIVNNGHLKRKEVETGITSLTRIEIKRGLVKDEAVALGAINAQPMTEGAEVTVVEDIN